MKYSIIFLVSFCFLFFQCKKENTFDVSNNDLNFIGSGSGCINFLVYKLNENKNIGLSVEGIKDALLLTQFEKTYNLSTEQHLTVKIEKFNQGDRSYCDDIVETDEAILNTYESISGFVKVQITEDSIGYSSASITTEILYKINVTLEDVLLQDNQGNELMIKNEFFREVLVGWFPG